MLAMVLQFNYPNTDLHTAGRKTAAFTLIEMLVVIAIISILASMLSPALHNAHRQVVALSCNNTMRNLGMILRDYEETYRKLPPYVDKTYNPPYAPWQWFLASFIDKSIPRTQGGFGAPSVYLYFTCPALDSKYSLLNHTDGSSRVHFGMNYWMNKKSTMRLRSPSKRFIIGEPAFEEPNTTSHVNVKTNSDINAFAPDDPARHHQQHLSPGLFADGHVENFHAPLLPKDEVYKYVKAAEKELYYFWGNGYSY